MVFFSFFFSPPPDKNMLALQSGNVDVFSQNPLDTDDRGLWGQLEEFGICRRLRAWPAFEAGWAAAAGSVKERE